VGANGIAGKGVVDGMGVGVGFWVGAGVRIAVGVGVDTVSTAQPMLLMTSAVANHITIRLLNFLTFYPCLFFIYCDILCVNIFYHRSLLGVVWCCQMSDGGPARGKNTLVALSAAGS
jgi:hypothetical protein